MQKKLLWLSVLGIFFSHGLAANLVGFPNKSLGDTLTAEEFNQVVETIESFYRDDQTGNIGIGVPAILATKLKVNGNVGASAYCDINGENCIDAISMGSDIWEKNILNGNISYTEGKVGIGTDDPKTELEVIGDVKIGDVAIRINGTNNVDVDPDIEFNASGLIVAEDKLNFYVDSDNDEVDSGFYFGSNHRTRHGGGDYLMVIKEPGSVGIGTSDPSSELEVAGDVEADRYCGRQKAYCFTAADVVVLLETNKLFLPWKESDTVDGAIYYDNKVGIGTDAPGYKLSVAGEIETDGLVGRKELWLNAFAKKGDLNPRDVIMQYDSRDKDLLRGNVGIGLDAPSAKLEVAGKIKSFATEPGDDDLVVTTKGYVDGQISGNSIWALNNGNAYRGTGNVGIGVDDPIAKLSVDGDIHVSGGSRFKWGDVSTLTSDLVFSSAGPGLCGQSNYSAQTCVDTYVDRFLIDGETGNVGIGVDDPIAKLSVDGDIHVSGGSRFKWGDVSTLTSDLVFSSAGPGLCGQSNYSAQTCVDTYVDRFLIDGETGNVGIGVDDPIAKLSVDGDIHVSGGSRFKWGDVSTLTSDLVFSSAGPGLCGQSNYSAQTCVDTYVDRFLIDGETGNIGIGVDNPREKLSINGDVLLSSKIKFGGPDTGGISDLIFAAYRQTNLNTNGVLYTDVMKIHTSGNVGIGVATPYTKLEVGGDISVPNDARFKFGTLNSTGNKFTFTSYVPNTSGLFGSSQTSPHQPPVPLTAEKDIMTLDGDTGNVEVKGTITAENPTADNHVATKGYVDTQISNEPSILKLEPQYDRISFDVNSKGTAQTTSFIQFKDNGDLNLLGGVIESYRSNYNKIDLESDGKLLRALVNASGVVLSAKDPSQEVADLTLESDGAVKVRAENSIDFLVGKYEMIPTLSISSYGRGLDVRGDINFRKTPGGQESCNTATEGRLTYNFTKKIFEGCDGVNWVALSNSATTSSSGYPKTIFSGNRISYTLDVGTYEITSCRVTGGTYTGSTDSGRNQCNPVVECLPETVVVTSSETYRAPAPSRVNSCDEWNSGLPSSYISTIVQIN